jgi:hypothetical protein
MRYGPTRTYWNDFAFEGYLSHRTEAIYLAGLPDVPESINRELKRLKGRVAVLEERKAKLIADLRK